MTRPRSHAAAVALVLLALTAACGGDDEDPAGAEPTAADSPDALTVEQVMDFASERHSTDPFRVEDAATLGLGDLTDCSWVTSAEEVEAFGDGVVALFHCTGGTDNEDGEYPVVVYEYDDEAAATAAIDDRLLSTGTALLRDGGIYVDGWGEDAQREEFFEALSDDCSCGEVFVVGEDD